MVLGSVYKGVHGYVFHCMPTYSERMMADWMNMTELAFSRRYSVTSAMRVHAHSFEAFSRTDSSMCSVTSATCAGLAGRSIAVCATRARAEVTRGVTVVGVLVGSVLATEVDVAGAFVDAVGVAVVVAVLRKRFRVEDGLSGVLSGLLSDSLGGRQSPQRMLGARCRINATYSATGSSTPRRVLRRLLRVTGTSSTPGDNRSLLMGELTRLL